MAWPSLIDGDPPVPVDVVGVAGDFPAGATGVVVDVALFVNTAASGELGEIPRSSVHSCIY